MKSDITIWIGIAGLAGGFGALIAFGASGGALALMAILAAVMFGAIGWSMRTDKDADWLPKWIVLGFVAKVMGTLARYYMVAVLYGGGDSFRYYRVGTEIANEWRSGSIPDLTADGGFGTQIVEWITGAMFAVFTPDMLGGFLMFSIIAYFGQLMLYAAFRHWGQDQQLKVYGLLIFLLPTYAFWPSSIGKDAIVTFAVGASAYCVARALRAYEVRWLVAFGGSLLLLGLIRIHVAAIVVAGLIGATIFAKMPEDVDKAARGRRLLVLVGGVGAGLVALTFFPDVFGVDLSGDGAVEAFANDVVRRTTERGTIAAGGPVTSPADIPGAIALVLFRPLLLIDGTEVQHLFAGLETAFILALTIFKLPKIFSNRKKWRANGYVVFSTFYVVAFAVAFSVIRNLGIIARQRGQVLAFFIVIVVALGWEERASLAPAKAQVPKPLPRFEEIDTIVTARARAMAAAASAVADSPMSSTSPMIMPDHSN